MASLESLAPSPSAPVIALVATDLDGTVIPPSGQIPRSIRESVRAARARGVRVLIATGRTYEAALPFLDALDADHPLICCQGALIHEAGGGVLHQVSMTEDDALAALEAGRAEAVPTLVYWTGTIGLDASADVDLAHPLLGLPQGGVTPVANLRAAIQAHPPLKLQYVVRDPGQTARLAARLAPQLARRTMLLATSGPMTLETTHATATKGHALAWIAQRLGIAPDAVLALGDQANDVSMLAWAGVGLAVANAAPAALAATPGRAPHVEDAPLAWALRTYGCIAP